MAPQDNVWAVGDERIYYNQFLFDRHSLTIHWDGTQWSRIPSPTPGIYSGGGTTVSLYDVVSISNDDAWAVGTYEAQHPVDGFIGFQTIAMHWEGKEWSVVPTPLTPAGMTGSSLNSVVAIASDSVYAAGHIVDPVPGDQNDWIGFALHWDGNHWSPLPQPPIPGRRSQFDDMAVIDQDTLIMIGGHSGQTYGARDQPFVVIWDGAWNLVDVPVPPGQNFLESVSVVAPDDIWIVGTNDQINEGYQPLFLHYDGSEWEVFDNVEFDHYGGSLRGVTSASNNRIYASGSFAPKQGDFNRPLLMEFDGTTWGQVPTDPNGPIGGTLFATDDAGNEVWAVGIQNGTTSQTQRLAFSDVLIGDVNRDGEVNLLDVAPFVTLLISGNFRAEADVNQDGVVNLIDVDPFADLLSGGEPSRRKPERR